jgi:hypothetical protein
MKTMKVWVVAVLVSFAVGISTPVSSQDNPSTSASERYDDRDNDSNWGWIGLLGLIGLAGLAKKRDVTVRDTNPGQVKYGTP